MSNSRGRFQGKVAFITGASDRGIGGAIAEAFVEEGASVFLFAIDEPKRLLRKLSRHDVESHWFYGDVTSDKEIRDGVADCVAKLGRIDILVNNAGVEFAKPFEEMKDDEWRHLMDVNLNGTIAVTQAVLPHLASPGGVIVNIASILGIGGCAGFAIYSASKAGMIGLTQSLAWELAPRKIRVVAVAPGFIPTPMTFKYVKQRDGDVRVNSLIEQIEAVHPLGTGSPSDVSAAVCFLASEEARWITGITLPLGWAPSYPLPMGRFIEPE